jgi:hypothetical protein
MKRIVLLLVSLSGAGLADALFAQNRPGTASGILADNASAPAPQSQDVAAGYTFPSAEKQFRFYANNVVGPFTLVSAAAIGAIDHGRNEPPEWGQGGVGFGRRYGSILGVNAINQTTLMLISAASRQDPIYYRCDCSGFGPRLKHALASGFTARNRRGQRVFSPAKLVAPFAGPMVSRTVWYPDRYGPGDGARAGAMALGFALAWNVAREFVLPAPKW